MATSNTTLQQLLIGMMHAKLLCQMPQLKKGNASSPRQLINQGSSHTNALQALSLNVRVQDLMLPHLMLATLGPETQREWEQIAPSRADTPISHTFGVQVSGIRVNSDYPVTEENSCHSMAFTWKQGH
jgi:hypothetical protein